MIKKMLNADTHSKPPTPKEGDLYKVIRLHGASFEIRYGYYADIDRDLEPMEIYPDFKSNPAYTPDGAPFVTLMQDPCPHYQPRRKSAEPDCSSCQYLERGEELIGICRCPQRKCVTKAGDAYE